MWTARPGAIGSLVARQMPERESSLTLHTQPADASPSTVTSASMRGRGEKRSSLRWIDTPRSSADAQHDLSEARAGRRGRIAAALVSGSLPLQGLREKPQSLRVDPAEGQRDLTRRSIKPAHADDGPNHHSKLTLESELEMQGIADLHIH